MMLMYLSNIVDPRESVCYMADSVCYRKYLASTRNHQHTQAAFTLQLTVCQCSNMLSKQSELLQCLSH